MTTRTTSMTHYNSAADGYIQLEAKASGLADMMFQGTKVLEAELEETNRIAIANGEKPLSLESAFSIAMSEVEHERSKELITLTGDSKMTLSKHSQPWRSRKSELLSCIKAGLSLKGVDSFTALRKLKDAKKGTNSSGDNTGNAKNKGTDNASKPAENVTALQPVTSNQLDSKVQTELNSLIEHMKSLTTEGQLKFIKDSNVALTRLTKVGGRFLATS